MGTITNDYKRELAEINEALEVETDKETIEVLEIAKIQVEKKMSDLEKAKNDKPKAKSKAKPEVAIKDKIKKVKPSSKPPIAIKDKLKKTDIKGVDALKVGESVKDSEGNVIKKTADSTYILEYHQDPGKNRVVFEKKGDKWLVDCCKKKGIEFKADEIHVAVEHVIEGLDCHYEIEKRKDSAKKRKEASEKYNSKTDAKKMEDAIEKAAETVENRVEDIKQDGKTVTKKQGERVVADVSDIIASISKGFSDKKERNAFIAKLIAELNKIMKSEKLEDGGSVELDREEEFVEYLNEVGVPEHDHPENDGRVGWDYVNFYGEWLQKNDPIAFQVAYNEWNY